MGKFFPYLILIPLSLSAFVHVWNPAGFPDIHGDEGHYIRRAINIMMGGAAEEPKIPEPNRHYGNPFFGQIFLSSVMTLTNYPNSIHLDDEVTANSVGGLFFVPRIVMGVLALTDTFIIYKIAERRYNTSTALAASILFSVMPFSWIIRRVLLESIELPFILSSVMFAVYYNKHSSSMNRTTYDKFDIGEIISISISGIFLGLAIFTKIPAFNMIPLIGFLIYTNNRHKGFKALGLWLIPVILIPSIWPVYAVLHGEADKWIEGLFWQANREGIGILSLGGLLKVDPLLLVLGIGGSIYALIRRDIFCVLWIIPFLIFFSVIGLVRIHNYIPLLPLFCLAGGILIADTYKLFRINKMSIKRILITGSIIGAIGAFALLNANLYIPNNVNSTYFELYSFVVRKLPVFSEDDENVNITNKVTVIGSNWVVSSFSWIPNNLYGNDHEFRTLDSNAKIETEKVLLVIDNRMKHILSDKTEQAKRFQSHQPQLKSLYDTSHTIAKFNITASEVFKDTASGIIEIKSNY
jgi:hypothetical protein